LARLARLWPLHLVTAALFVVAKGVPREALPLNLLLLHGWVPVQRIYFSGNPVSWSLSTEAMFCIAFPLLRRSLSRNWPAKLSAAALAAAALIALCNAFELPLFEETAVSAHGLLYIHPLARMLEFCAGMRCCLLWRNLRGMKGGTWAFTAAECLAIAAAGLLIAFPFPFAHAALGPAGTLWIARTSAMPAFCAIVVVFAFGRGLLSRLAGSRPLEFLGEISFALYLIHVLTIAAYAKLSGLPVAAWAPADFVGAAMLTMLAAALLHVGVEKPCRAAILRLGALQPAGPYTPGGPRP
jgi:peptidoglycan/LPS O-acetylase OafA/YrhL